MVMGSPELPNEDQNTLPRPPLNNLPMHGAVGGTSDESDVENDDNAYAGYQPLAIDDDTSDVNMDEDDDDDEHGFAVDFASFQATNIVDTLPDTGIHVVSVDAEVEGEVWNAPRPQMSDIQMDSTRTAQIMSAMAQISIPPMAIPEWAQGVSEDKWKEDLLERIRQRQLQRNQNNVDSSSA